jgi:hypothetical protein
LVSRFPAACFLFASTRTSCIRGTASHVPRAPGNQEDIFCISTSALKHKTQYDTRCDTSPRDLLTAFTAQSLPKLAMTTFSCQKPDFSPGRHKPSHLATIMCTTHMHPLFPCPWARCSQWVATTARPARPSRKTVSQPRCSGRDVSLMDQSFAMAPASQSPDHPRESNLEEIFPHLKSWQQRFHVTFSYFGHVITSQSQPRPQ